MSRKHIYVFPCYIYVAYICNIYNFCTWEFAEGGPGDSPQKLLQTLHKIVRSQSNTTCILRGFA